MRAAGPLLASGSDHGTAELWDLVTGAPAGPILTGHTGPVTSVAFGTDPGGALLASGSDDRTVRLWDPLTAACVSMLCRRSAVHAVALAGAMLAIGDDEGVSVLELNA